MDGYKRGYKYKDLRIYAHPRSGNWYTAALFYENFFKLPNQTYEWKFREEGISPHARGDQAVKVLNKPYLIIHLIRNYLDTIKSLYRMRFEFGYKQNLTFEQFQDTPINKISNTKKSKSNIPFMRNGIRADRDGFHPKNLEKTDTVRQYYYTYYKSWKPNYRCNNVIIISYDDLISNFKETMLRLAKKLGSNRTKFIDINKRVGYYLAEEKNIIHSKKR